MRRMTMAHKLMIPGAAKALWRTQATGVRAQKLLCRPNSGNMVLGGVRYYSDKYKDIDEFNKSKTEYNFHTKFKGLDIPETHGGSTEINTAELHAKVSQQIRDQEIKDVNLYLESDPRLKQFEYGSPEYKEMMHQINQEFNAQQKKNHKSQESRERWKAAIFGIGVVTLIAVGHQFIFHYQWYKQLFNSSSYKINEDAVKAPVKNTKALDHLQTKLAAIIDKAFVDGVLDSKSNTGLYLFGSHNGKRLPTRLDFFNGMILKDVKTADGLLVVVADDGKAYQYTAKMKKPQQIELPSKAVKCEVSKDFVYFLDKNGEVAYISRPDKGGVSPSSTYRSWLGLKKQKAYQTLHFTDDATEGQHLLRRGEKISDMAAGDAHMLVLSNKGRLFTVKTGEGENVGQFGVPGLAPVMNPQIPVNKVFEMKLLNNELLVVDGVKSVRPRVFKSIATGKNHCLASDADGNVWTWGRNSFGQCGVELNYKNDIQSVPAKVIDKTILSSVVKGPVVSITDVYANDDTSFVGVKLKDDSDALVSFGCGIKGQLGINRYLHLSHLPQMVKALSLTEFDETAGKVKNIGIKKLSTGGNHSIVQLDNSGGHKDVLIFGDNEFGQFGNGKVVRSPKPTAVPNLIEPKDVSPQVDMRKLAKTVNDPDNRLALAQELKINGTAVEQVIQASGDNTVIYYKRK